MAGEIICHQRQIPDTAGVQQPSDFNRCHAAFMSLPAGHRHRVIIENLVGNIHICCDRRADRHQTGMVKGTIADILEHMAAGRKTRLANPVGPFPAHMGVAFNIAVHELGHPVTANTGITARTFRQHS